MSASCCPARSSSPRACLPRPRRLYVHQSAYRRGFLALLAELQGSQAVVSVPTVNHRCSCFRSSPLLTYPQACTAISSGNLMEAIDPTLKPEYPDKTADRPVRQWRVDLNAPQRSTPLRFQCLRPKQTRSSLDCRCTHPDPCAVNIRVRMEPQRQGPRQVTCVYVFASRATVSSMRRATC